MISKLFDFSFSDPSAMVPCIDDNIPVYVRNIFNPAFEGTVVQGRSPTLKETASSGKSVNWRAKKVRIFRFFPGVRTFNVSFFSRVSSLSRALLQWIKLP